MGTYKKGFFDMDDETISKLSEWFPASNSLNQSGTAKDGESNITSSDIAPSKDWAVEMELRPKNHTPHAWPWGVGEDPYGNYAYIVHFCDDESWLLYRTLGGTDPWERFNEVEHRDADVYRIRIADPDLPKLGIPVTYRETLDWLYETCHIEPEYRLFWDAFFTHDVPWTLIPKTVEIDLSDKDFELCVGIDENRVGCRDSYHIIAFGESSSGCA